MPQPVVVIDLGAGEARVGGTTVGVAARPGGALAVGSRVLRPLRFGERWRLLVDAGSSAGIGDSGYAAGIGAAVLAAATVPDAAVDGPPVDEVITRVLALHLAGARPERDVPGCATELADLVAAGWTPRDVFDADADLIDLLAESGVDDDGWTSVVLAGDEPAPGSPEVLRLLEGDLLHRLADVHDHQRTAAGEPPELIMDSLAATNSSAPRTLSGLTNPAPPGIGAAHVPGAPEGAAASREPGATMAAQATPIMIDEAPTTPPILHATTAPTMIDTPPTMIDTPPTMIDTGSARLVDRPIGLGSEPGAVQHPQLPTLLAGDQPTSRRWPVPIRDAAQRSILGDGTPAAESRSTYAGGVSWSGTGPVTAAWADPTTGRGAFGPAATRLAADQPAVGALDRPAFDAPAIHALAIDAFDVADQLAALLDDESDLRGLRR